MNNFQELESKQSNRYPESTKNIKKKVDHTVDVYRFIGSILDLYFPKIVGFMNSMLGGESSSSPKSKYPNKQ
jgi:hypothetical protein